MDGNTNLLSQAIAQSIHRENRTVAIDYVDLWTPQESGLKKWWQAVGKHLFRSHPTEATTTEYHPKLKKLVS